MFSGMRLWHRVPNYAALQWIGRKWISEWLDRLRRPGNTHVGELPAEPGVRGADAESRLRRS